MSFHKKLKKQNAGGQAAVEYVLLVTVVLSAFAGVAVLFSNQVDHYLSLLFDVIVLPI